MVTTFSKPLQVSVTPLFIIHPFILRDITTLSTEEKHLYTFLYKTKNSCTKLFFCLSIGS